ncbi:MULTISPECIES: pyruvate formate-lyase-activating protein [Caproicibacterium]|uniref:Pyruvate formate-lyase-activating enzyme n=1 Tax=Caproicibacterium argilliputei TaxID=3030016 RepID=A0AA97DA25_9FIRM|nr:pyruvate formate-lyase-activating protein [Caproicibacterium argilliputei]WOC32412.1 pyruvate formate-lyase-activating protein [Caproicibacterium argilliputei]
MTLGSVHSLETMGLVDGPGVRVVVFLQGCALRCRFCHNPDTWEADSGEQVTPQELLHRIVRCKPYFVRSGGGVTFSGGEPLLQPEFLLETLRLCREADIHTCLDTAGCGRGMYDEILRYTDLVLYDVKQVTEESYRKLTGRDWTETGRFLQAVRRAGTPVWVRHVVVPGLTDSEAHMAALRAFVSAHVPNVQKVELLPYHLLGVQKYKTMGLMYPLAGVPAMDTEQVKTWQARYFDSLDGSKSNRCKK